MSTGTFVMLLIMMVLGVLGLNMAAHGADATFTWVGWVLFGFAVFYSFAIIRRATGPAEEPDWDGG